VKVVRSKEDGRVLAMKTMRKDQMVLKNQVAHVRAERDALAQAFNPWVVQLHFSFQDDDNLYLVMDYCAGGDLMTLLIKVRFPRVPSAVCPWLHFARRARSSRVGWGVARQTLSCAVHCALTVPHARLRQYCRAGGHPA
jgi:serine/threonine protein kinase